ncbi:MAG: GIY-YIG nuclease family protein [Rhizobiales bacterium]|nr:GIY-YIG nuclease family protein [Hyphomicrobiales bacterium]NRB13247.1 GIY-YIG nuclease family protein [Hyphomicrobiales bacterium]
MATSGRSLELYFINGKPDGMLTATVPFQWTGHVLMTSRNQISEALKRKEASRSGVYILFGENEEGALAYIGETEEIRQRIKNHARTKDWWTSVVMITDTGDELNKAHVRYLESRLVAIAQDADRIPLENGTIPVLPSLSEAAIANMEGFLENILLVLPALRIDCFLKETRSTLQKQQPERSDINEDVQFEMRTPKHGVKGEAILRGGEFIVLKGSIGRKEWGGSLTHNYRQLFEKMVQKGILSIDGNHATFTENYAFSSPSAAGAMLNGRATNGPRYWIVKGTRKSYKDWEAEQLASSEDESIKVE